MDKSDEAAAALRSEVQAVKAWIDVEKARIRGTDKDFAAIQETAESERPCAVEPPAGLDGSGKPV